MGFHSQERLKKTTKMNWKILLHRLVELATMNLIFPVYVLVSVNGCAVGCLSDQLTIK